MEELHFSVDIGGIALLYIQKEYERLIDKYNEEEKEIEKKILIYPLFDEWKDLTNEESLELLDSYSKNLYRSIGVEQDQIILSAEYLKDFAKDFMIKKMEEHKTKVEKKIRGKDITVRRLNELRYYESYVYDLNTDTLINNVKYGCHYDAICEILHKQFGDCYMHKINIAACDKYIDDHVILKGNTRSYEWYKELIKR